MAFFQVEVVGWSKHVGGHDSGELGSVVLVEALVQNVDHSLCVGVSVVRSVRGSVVNLLYKQNFKDFLKWIRKSMSKKNVSVK